MYLKPRNLYKLFQGAEVATKKTMSKRRKTTTRVPRDSLTGGTRDVNPQMYKIGGIFQNAGTSGTTANGLSWLYFLLPSNPFAKGDPVIMEWLRIEWEITPPVVPINTTPDTPLVNRQASVVLVLTVSQFQTGVTSLNPLDPGAISRRTVINSYVNGASAMKTQQFNSNYEVDCTDGAGHGFLVAGNQIAVACQFSGCNGGSQCQATAWITYRFKQVNLEEYIGLVEGQQISVNVG